MPSIHSNASAAWLSLRECNLSIALAQRPCSSPAYERYFAQLSESNSLV